MKNLINRVRTLECSVKIALAASLLTGAVIWVAAAAVHLTTGWFPHWQEAVALIAVTATLGPIAALCRAIVVRRRSVTEDDQGENIDCTKC